MKVLGLDVSTVSTGWAVLTDGPTLGEYGLIPFEANTPEHKVSEKRKLVVFREVVKGLITKFSPDIVIIEDTYVQFDPSVTKKLSRFAGVAIEGIASVNMDLTIVLLTTQSIRAALFPKQKMDKKAVRAKMIERYNLDPKTKDDITDAIASSHYPLIKKVKDEWIV